MSNFKISIELEVDDRIDVVCGLAELIEKIPRFLKGGRYFGQKTAFQSDISPFAKGSFIINDNYTAIEEIKGRLPRELCECDIIGEKHCPMHCMPCECTGNGVVCWQCR